MPKKTPHFPANGEARRKKTVTGGKHPAPLSLNRKEARSVLKNKKTRWLLIAAAAAAVIITGVFLFLNIKTQRSKADELEAERQKRQEQLEKLRLEYENIEERIEYVKSDEFLLRYARENWGYLPEGDIRFDVNDPHLPDPAVRQPAESETGDGEIGDGEIGDGG